MDSSNLESITKLLQFRDNSFYNYVEKAIARIRLVIRSLTQRCRHLMSQHLISKLSYITLVCLIYKS